MPNLAELKTDIENGTKEHEKHQTWDAYTYNTFAILSIVFASAAAVFPITKNPDLVWLIRALAGASAILISLKKSLNFGSRWIYHREMKHAYLVVASKIYFYENLPEGYTDSEKKKIFGEIFQEYYKLKIREGQMPGVHTDKKGTFQTPK